MYAVRINNKDYQAANKTVLKIWLRQRRISPTTHVWDFGLQAWFTVKDILYEPVTPNRYPVPQPGHLSNHQNLPRHQNQVPSAGDISKDSVDNFGLPTTDKLRYNILVPPDLTCPKCGHIGKARLQGLGVTVFGIFRISFAILIGPILTAIAFYHDTFWGWVAVGLIILEIIEFFLRMLFKRHKLNCAKCGFLVPTPEVITK